MLFLGVTLAVSLLPTFQEIPGVMVASADLRLEALLKRSPGEHFAAADVVTPDLPHTYCASACAFTNKEAG